MTTTNDVQAYWNQVQIPMHGALTADRDVDVAIIGAGITGLMTAYLLQQQGASVIVLERNRIGSGETANTTAHLTCMTDVPLSELVDTFGRDHAVAAWDAGQAAIEKIHEIVHAERIECGFCWVPGHYVHSIDEQQPGDAAWFQREASLLDGSGFESSLLELDTLTKRIGLRLEHQAKFHPLAFLKGIAQSIEAGGEQRIFEDTEVTKFGDDNSIQANGRTVRAGTVIVATHVPLQGRVSTAKAALFQTKLYPYTSYVIRHRITTPLIEGLYWDTTDPYYYLRIDKEENQSFAILGGADAKTGQEHDPRLHFLQLTERMSRLFPGSVFTHQWAGQVVETNDGLPFIGEIEKNQWIATGFAGNGMTFGTVAAMTISDHLSGRIGPWSELFHPDRVKIKGGAWDYFKENIDYPYYMVKQRLMGNGTKEISTLSAGQGGIFKVDGKRVAACKTHDGTAHTVSPVCTHLGCFVNWNGALESWDCPCHGSRFAPDGQVLGGPAETPLARQVVSTDNN